MAISFRLAVGFPLVLLAAACDQSAPPQGVVSPERGDSLAIHPATEDDAGESAVPRNGDAARPAAARKASELDPRAVTLMAYNLRNYLVMERGKAELPKPDREIRAVLAMIEDVKPDLLGVCEIGTEADLKDLQTRLLGVGVDLPHLEYCDGPDPVRNLGLLSKFPIVARNHQTRLAYRVGDQEFPFQRGILDATVEPVPGYRLRLLGTHLKSKRGVESGDQNEMRRNEAALLRRHVDAILAETPGTNLLLYGDLNDTKETEVFKSILGTEGRPDFLQALWLRDRFGYTWTHYWIAADSYSRIDYAICSKALLPEILKKDSYIHHAPEWLSASDHRPIVVRLLPEDQPVAKSRK